MFKIYLCFIGARVTLGTRTQTIEELSMRSYLRIPAIMRQVRRDQKLKPKELRELQGVREQEQAEAAARPADEGAQNRKQSQSTATLTVVKASDTEYYGESPRIGRRENEAGQSQIRDKAAERIRSGVASG